MLLDSTSLDKLAHRENELRQVQILIGHLLSELSECEADEGCRIPSPPVGELSQGIAGMLFRLRHNLANDDMFCKTENIQGWTKNKDAALKSTQLHEQRSLLIDKLDDLAELVSSSCRISSWSEIEVRFLHFSLSLTEHLADLNGMVKRRPQQRAECVDLADQLCDLNKTSAFN